VVGGLASFAARLLFFISLLIIVFLLLLRLLMMIGGLVGTEVTPARERMQQQKGVALSSQSRTRCGSAS